MSLSDDQADEVRKAVADFKRFIELSDNKQWKKTAQQLLDKLEANKDQNKSPNKNGSG